MSVDFMPRFSAARWVVTALFLVAMANAWNVVFTINRYIASGYVIGFVAALVILFATVTGLGLQFPWFRERFTWGAVWYFLFNLCPVMPMGVIVFTDEFGLWLWIRLGGGPAEVFLFLQTLVIGQVNVLICLAIGHIVMRHLRKRAIRPLPRDERQDRNQKPTPDPRPTKSETEGS